MLRPLLFIIFLIYAASSAAQNQDQEDKKINVCSLASQINMKAYIYKQITSIKDRIIVDNREYTIKERILLKESKVEIYFLLNKANNEKNIEEVAKKLIDELSISLFYHLCTGQGKNIINGK